jgi:hypothetical protein
MSWEPIDPENPSDDALIGDDPFDLFGKAIDQVTQAYRRDLRRKPSIHELVTTFERVLETHFADAVSEGQTAELVSISFKIRAIPKRQKFKAGDFLKATAADGRPVYGRIFTGRPPFGDAFSAWVGVYDSLGLEKVDLHELRQRPLVVKAMPIHPEILQKREWLVIGHLPLDDHDATQPHGLPEVSGVNSPLIAANYFYGLSAERWYNIEKFLNR